MRLFDEKGWIVPGLSAGDKVVLYKDGLTIKFTTSDNQTLRIGCSEKNDDKWYLGKDIDHAMIMSLISLATGLAHRLVENTPMLVRYELYNWPA
ncbi:MAG: hypothetical protein PHC70_00120 [Patescibacteria group bacterium]|jgi:hypothetical protein|nr:hypothetical protein [Patescibacteria group bacterium]